MARGDYKRGGPIALFGMSGVGKTRMAAMLRREADWFHYSVDYRIGTRYLNEAIMDNAKREAMRSPFLKELLLSDSIYLASNITFDNLAPLSAYLGKPGDPDKGGIPFAEYIRRQRLHRAAEIAAMADTKAFIERALEIYGYSQFICDASGSICEVVDPDDDHDPVLRDLASRCLIVVIQGDEDHASALKARFDKAPKPMYYNEGFLTALWSEYLTDKNISADAVNPDEFIRWGFARLIDWRAPRFHAIAQNWGVSLSAKDVEKVQSPDEFLDLIDKALKN